MHRKCVDIRESEGSAIAEDAIKRIAALHAVEKAARHEFAEERVALRQAKAKPVLEDLEAWLCSRRRSQNAPYRRTDALDLDISTSQRQSDRTDPEDRTGEASFPTVEPSVCAGSRPQPAAHRRPRVRPRATPARTFAPTRDRRSAERCFRFASAG